MYVGQESCHGKPVMTALGSTLPDHAHSTDPGTRAHTHADDEDDDESNQQEEAQHAQNNGRNGGSYCLHVYFIC